MKGARDSGEVYFGRQKPEPSEWGGRLPVALVFPGSMKIGLSSLGWQAVYRLLRSCPELAVERFFLDRAPGPPFAFDTGRALSDFPVIAFSLNFEEEYKALVQTLDRADIPLRAKDRTGWPLVLAGGPLCFLNPEPIAPAIDLFWVGEAEAGLLDILAVCREHVVSGAQKNDFLDRVKNAPGVYAPGKSALSVRRAVHADAGRTLQTPTYSCFVSPEAEFRDMLLLEMNRGCGHGCRFCAAGYIYRPPRLAELSRLRQIVERVKPAKVGLVGTALTDHPGLLPFLTWLHSQKIKFSLSSLRADGLSFELLSFLRKTGTRSVTLALEGASARLRRAMNKNLLERDFLSAIQHISALQFNHLKIYLIAGWPGEIDADYVELALFLKKIQAAISKGRGEKKKGIGHVTFSVSCLVPKPWTPFQWAPMASEERLSQAISRIKDMLKPLPGFRLKAEKPFSARLQGLIARGDERVFDLILLAAQKDSWKKALAAWEHDPASYLDQERGKHEPFAWECVDTGVSRDYLYQEWERYKSAKSSPACPAMRSPRGCGPCDVCGVGKWLQA
ncbi:MAG: radical SAM protein [Thermodesulfobacteriota bacterium]|nr:radical SAM protein [Thermodesulfobacteriota bacterium]